MQIPHAQKDTDDLTVFYVLSGSARVKAAHKMLVKLNLFEIDHCSVIFNCITAGLIEVSEVKTKLVFFKDNVLFIGLPQESKKV